MLNIQFLVNEAKSLVTDIQNYLLTEYEGQLIEPHPILHEDQVKLLKQNFLQIEFSTITDLHKITSTTQYLKYMDLSYVIEFIKQYPDYIYDNRYFALPFASLDDEFKVRQLEQYSGYFNDVKWFICDLANYPEALIKQQKDLIIRNRYSLEFLNGKTI